MPAIDGATVGVVSRGINIRIPGTNAGRDSYAAIAKSLNTRLRRGSISSVSTKLFGKAVTADVVGGSGAAATGAAASAAQQNRERDDQ